MRTFLMISLMVLVLALVQQKEGLAKTSLGPAGTVVKAYCALDAMAAGTSSATVPYLRDFTVWETGPGWDAATLIDGFEIVAETYQGDTAQVTVQYAVAGELTSAPAGGALHTLGKKTKTVVFTLKQDSKAWKITGPENNPHILRSVANQYESLKPKNP